MKSKRSGFTIVELLTAVVIISILVSLLVPALSVVRNIAKEAKQKAQLTTIDLVLVAFKNDYGDYPPSSSDEDYSGAQKLAEALVGWDLMGFHPDSAFRSDGKDDDDKEIYPASLNINNPDHVTNLKERKGPYLESSTANAFKLRDLFGTVTGLEANTYVLCDSFGVRKITLNPSGNKPVNFKAGTPILYYRANTSSKDHMTDVNFKKRIYNAEDNKNLTALKSVTPDGTEGNVHPLDADNYKAFYDHITDPKVAISWPYRADSYILISAGADGLYGTEDDITNFGK